MYNRPIENKGEITMKVETLLNKIKLKQVYGNTNQEVNDVTTDSRTATEKSIFVASRGYTVDSHEFIPNVIEQGCTVIVSDRYIELSEEVLLIVVKDTLKIASIFSHIIFEYPSQKLKTIGVTGTNGKTTIATMVHHLTRALVKIVLILEQMGFKLMKL